MVLQSNAERRNSPVKIDLFDRLTKGGLLIVGIIGILKDRDYWLPYVFFAVGLAALYPRVKPLIGRWWARRKRNRVLKHYRQRFRSHVRAAQEFAGSSNDYGISWGLSSAFSGTKNLNIAFVLSTSSIFAICLRHLAERCELSIKNFEQFQGYMQEFAEIMTQFVVVYQDNLLQELKKSGMTDSLTPEARANLTSKYNAFATFVYNYNVFRKEVAANSGEPVDCGLIRIPVASLH